MLPVLNEALDDPNSELSNKMTNFFDQRVAVDETVRNLGIAVKDSDNLDLYIISQIVYELPVNGNGIVTTISCENIEFDVETRTAVLRNVSRIDSAITDNDVTITFTSGG